MDSQLLFSDYFQIDSEILDHYGALNICIDSDLPLFVDPFLLFASEKLEYKVLHNEIVNHLIRLKEIALKNPSCDTSLFQFPEVKQNWLGFCKYGNNGKGLGPKFARNLVSAFNGFYSNFGEEEITSSSHIEKLTLVGSGIGRDFISDFSTNLLLEYLLEYTQTFTLKFLPQNMRRRFSVRCKFDSELFIWRPREFELPYFYLENGDFIILTPLDILTKDDAFICHKDLTSQFQRIVRALENTALRDAVNNFFQKCLPREPKKSDIELAVDVTLRQFPDILDFYIEYKEKSKDKAAPISAEKVQQLKTELLSTLQEFCRHMAKHNSAFFSTQPTSYEAALQRAHYLKQVIEDNDGYRIFYKDGKAISYEDTIQRIFRLTWFAVPYDVNSEVNNGRGSADYKISYGERDSVIVEFKLASSSSLKRNLLNQVEIYKKASKTINDIKVILCYSKREVAKVRTTLRGIGQEGAENIVIIDASRKLSASNV